MITVEEALVAILENVPTMGTESVELRDLSGRVLAEEVIAPIDLPIFTNSSVDGYAVRSADTGPGASLKVVDTIAAGTESSHNLQPGEAIRLFTGAPLPCGANAVVMQEEVELTHSGLRLASHVDEGACVRFKGEEVKQGDPVIDPETFVSPPVIGVLASFGITRANVYKRPRVSIIGTGSELVPPGRVLESAQIYESNTVSINAAVKAMGCLVVGVYNVGDEAGEMQQALQKALGEADVVITCGGISVGEHDVVRETARGLGITEIFWRVAMRPGKPFYFGVSAEGKPVFGLPGNPVSALVTWFLLIKPALLKMVGLFPTEQWFPATLGDPIRKQKGRADFVRATSKTELNGQRPRGLERESLSAHQMTVVPTEGQGSHMLTGLANAEYLIHLPASVEVVEAGDTVSAVKINWGIA